MPNSLNTIDTPLTPKQTILYLRKNKLNAKATIKHPERSIKETRPQRICGRGAKGKTGKSKFSGGA